MSSVQALAAPIVYNKAPQLSVSKCASVDAPSRLVVQTGLTFEGASDNTPLQAQTGMHMQVPHEVVLMHMCVGMCGLHFQLFCVNLLIMCIFTGSVHRIA